MSQAPESQDTSDIMRTCLNFLPQQTTERIISRLQQAIHYEPVIGIMGKSGAGKSSLCNALFQQPVCLTSDLLGCTREPQRIVLTVGERSMTLVDLPDWRDTGIRCGIFGAVSEVADGAGFDYLGPAC